MPNDFGIFNIKTEVEFKNCLQNIYKYQIINNSLYASWCNSISKKWNGDIETLPFLPIDCFKTNRVYTADSAPALTFESSGTTNQLNRSKHDIAFLKLYEKSFVNTFENQIAAIHNLKLFGLLPGYLDRPNSSLIYMVEHLQQLSNDKIAKNFNADFENLTKALHLYDNQPKILIGVAHALIDYCEYIIAKKIQLHNLILIETGGMKGRKQEIIREEMHAFFQQALKPTAIFSEYGMTELLSQAYSKDGKWFNPPPWMKVTIRNIHDPFETLPINTVGCINIIDLCNIYSCPFIATDDLGMVNEKGQFTVLGRVDHAEMRGCNLMWQ